MKRNPAPIIVIIICIIVFIAIGLYYYNRLSRVEQRSNEIKSQIENVSARDKEDSLFIEELQHAYDSIVDELDSEMRVFPANIVASLCGGFGPETASEAKELD